MNDEVLDFTYLSKKLGYKRPSDVIRWLETNNVRYKLSRNKPITSMSAFNRALIGDYHEQEIMGVTGHKDHHSGHKSEKTKAVYLRGVDKIEPTGE